MNPFFCWFEKNSYKNKTVRFESYIIRGVFLIIILISYFSDSPEKSPRKSPKVSKSKPEPPKEAREINHEFATFLNSKLERPGVYDVSKNVKGMVEKIHRFQLLRYGFT